VFVASFAYSFFLDNMSNMSVIYGTLAGFLSLFIWIMIFSYSIILGAEVIAAYIDLKKGKVKKIPKDLEDKLPESIKEEL
ncbi:MAG: YihY/virulence factor BrkB family protein, partial [Anaerococcus sp.]